MSLRVHPALDELVHRAEASHRQGRNPAGITDDDVARARLYCYAFRLHVIGTFHATRLALEQLDGQLDGQSASSASLAWRTRAVEALEDLANLSADPVPRDFRVVVSTLDRYHRGIQRVVDSLDRDYGESSSARVGEIAERFSRIIEGITSGPGIHLTQDTQAPEQASFVVPNLGIVIVPLVYGDHHSWNLAYLAGEQRNVPTHLHHHGVEIHLGYDPTRGMTVLGEHRAEVDEGYAMPIPPETDHGWVNTGTSTHHVPFIFGSLKHAGWGVFLDVEAQTRPVDELKLVPRDSPAFSQMVYLERQITTAAAMKSCWRTTLIGARVTDRGGSGGLELSMTRINPAGYTYAVDDYRIVSIARGEGIVSIEGIDRPVRHHDHFGIPPGMTATLHQSGDQPLVALDALIKGHRRAAV